MRECARRAGVSPSAPSHHFGNVTGLLTAIATIGFEGISEAMEQALHLPADALAASWQSLDQVGNLSSSSVLHVLADTLEQTARAPETVDTHGVLMAMGPGFCTELVLLQW